MKISFKKNYAYAFNGYRVVYYKAGTVLETDSLDLIDNAVTAGAAEAVTDEAPAKKARKSK